MTGRVVQVREYVEIAGTAAEVAGVALIVGGLAIATLRYAVFRRDAIEALARDCQVPFVGLWLDAPEGQRLDRVRRRFADPSDADATVVLHQQADGTVHWDRIDASRDTVQVLRDAQNALARRGIAAHA